MEMCSLNRIIFKRAICIVVTTRRNTDTQQMIDG